MESYIHEKSTPIIIKKSNTCSSNELSLTHTFIDPAKMTPPNNFMEKLYSRMESYYSPSSGCKPTNTLHLE